jgi:argininosuccinate synthase
MAASKGKVVLAYSGGLDTSVICKWLDEQGWDVICFVANIGQREDFSTLEAKALGSGAKKLVLRDLRDEFVRDFVYPALQFNALYEGRYLLGTSLARPLIAKGMVAVAEEEGAEWVSHGATGKGNDQVRFELTAYALKPNVKVVVPWREPDFYQKIRGRTDAIAYCKEHNIPIKATTSQPWSNDENLMHLSFEAGILEDPALRPPHHMFELTTSPQDAPETPTALSLEFEHGIPVKLDGKALGPADMLAALNDIGGRNAIGRVDMVESRFVGMKSRGVYETPGATILMAAHRDLEGLTLDRGVINLKDTLMPRFAQMVYQGYWYSPEMRCLMALLKESQRSVAGKVGLELYKGNITITGRTSPVSLYDPTIATMDESERGYDPRDATGFIRLLALPLRADAVRQRKMPVK